MALKPPTPTPPTPDETLLNAAKTFETRNEEYGGLYRRHGKLMKAIFPHGIVLKTEADFYNFQCITMMAAKLARIANAYDRDASAHVDSVLDSAVYGAMFLEGPELPEIKANKNEVAQAYQKQS